MAVDLEAIRRRLATMNGARADSSVQLWKPDAGTYRVRGVPWKNAPEGLPFIERRICYIGDNRGFLAPEQFGKPDPVADLRRKLFSSKDPTDREVAKKLMPKSKAYMAVIVRGQEDKGVQVWPFTNFVHNRLLSFYTDEELGNIDILDPEEGYDLKVVLTPSGKKFQGRTFLDTTVDPARVSTKLSNDPAQAKKWLESVPNLDSMWQEKTEADIRKMLDGWLATGASDSASDGTSRGTEPQDKLNELANDLKSEANASGTPAADARPKADKPAEPEAAKAKRARKPAEADVDDQPAVSKKTLDEAFDELMKNDD